MPTVKPTPLLAVLVPVRDGEGDLPGFLGGVAGLADVVVALDDGSGDRTWGLLAASSLVRVLVRVPGGGVWDDAANRQMLLDVAGVLRPRWVLFLDVDERVSADDGAALREFLTSDALPGCAYGLQHFRAWGDRHDPAFTWVYRLFAWAPGLALPDARLHFNPVPVAIPRQRFVNTTIRVRHLGADSPARLAARARKYAHADPRGRHGGVGHGGLDRPPPSGTLRSWETRAPGLPVLAPTDLEPPGPRRVPVEPSQMPPRSRDDGDRPLLAVLVPVRDGEGDLPGFLGGVAGLADVVVALDDGSGDRTWGLLAASSLVRVLVRVPGGGVWDDAANRQMLLDVAGVLRPRWVLFLDVDERVSADDGAALREFLTGDALPGFGYGLTVCRMIDDLEHFDRDGLVAWRLFAWEPGQRLPGERLHLVPLPESIAPERRLATTLRIQHLASLTAERRRSRRAKYRRQDPDNKLQRGYEHLLDAPGPLRRFTPRAPEQPVLAPGDDPDLEGPALSAIVIAREDADRIESAVRAVLEQDCPEPFEVIVVVSGAPRTAAVVRERFPAVRLVELAEPVLPGAARNAGLRLARGEFVSFPGSHVRIAPGALAARLRAHRAGAAMVTGSIVNGTDTPAGWASYFIDHADALPGRPSGDLPGPPVRCSYMRHHLEQIGGFPEDLRAGEDTVVNRELHRRGYRARRVQEIVLVHRSRCETVPQLLRHHFARGRALSRILASDGVSLRSQLRHARRYVPTRLRYIEGGVGLWGGELEPRFARVRRLVVAGVLAAWAGYVVELVSSVRR